MFGTETQGFCNDIYIYMHLYTSELFNDNGDQNDNDYNNDNNNNN